MPRTTQGLVVPVNTAEKGDVILGESLYVLWDSNGNALQRRISIGSSVCASKIDT